MRGPSRALLALAVCVVAMLALSPGAMAHHKFDRFIGGASGSAEGQFSVPNGLAVNHATGQLYVSQSSRIQRFNADGDFELMWGRGVRTGGIQAEICTAAQVPCQGATEGTGAGMFNMSPSSAVAVNQATGNVFAFDLDNRRIQEFTASGNFVRTWGWGVATGASAFEVCTANCRAGLAGSGIGQISSSGGSGFGAGIAISPLDGDVFLADNGNRRVNRYNANGTLNTPDELQRLAVDATGGTYTLTFEGQTTAPIAFDATYTEVQAALVALSNIGPNDVAVFGGPGSAGATTPYSVNFLGAYQGTDVASIVTDATLLTGGASTAAVTTTVQGSPTATVASVSIGSLSNFGSGRPLAITVDSRGILYAGDSASNSQIDRYDTYVANNPNATGLPVFLTSIASPPLLASGTSAGATTGLAIDPDSDGAAPGDVDRLYVLRDPSSGDTVVQQFNSPGLTTAPAAVADTHGVGVFGSGQLRGLAINPGLGRLYITNATTGNACGSPCHGVVVLDADGTVNTIDATVAPPVNVGTTSADLSGTVDPGEGLAKYRFEISQDGINWTSLPEKSVDGTGPQNVIATATGLTPNTFYRVRLIATKILGLSSLITDNSSELNFITDAAPPAAQTIPTSDMGTTSATLYGRVNPNGQVTTYHFDWGPTSAYGNTAPVPDNLVGSGGVDKIVSHLLTGLSPNTTYHYRVVATNAQGTTKGADATFTTRLPGSSDARAFEMVTPPFKVVRAPVMERGEDGANPNVGIPSLDGERIGWMVPFFPLTDEVGWPDSSDKRIIDRTPTGWVHQTLNTLATMPPFPNNNIVLVSQRVNGSSGDLSTFAWDVNNGAAGQTGGYTCCGLLPTEGPVPNVLYTNRPGTGVEGFTPWLTNPSLQIKALESAVTDYGSSNLGGDDALLNDDGSVMARWGWYGGLAEDYGTLADEDPADNQPLLGRMIYLQSAVDPDEMPSSPKDLVNECTGTIGGGDATLVPERDANGTPADFSDDRIDTQPCEQGSLVAGARGGVVGGASSAPGGAPTQGPASTAVSEDGNRIFFQSPDPEAGGTSCQNQVGVATLCPPQLFVRQYDSNGNPVVRWISRPQGIGPQAIAAMGSGSGFQGASRNGRYVYFQTNAPLLPTDPNGGNSITADPASDKSWDLYRYELPASLDADPGTGTLTRISGGPTGNSDANTNPSTASSSLRFLSDDGSRAYFVTGAPLAGADATAPAGGTTTPSGTATNTSSRNLYVFDDSKVGAEKYRFVAQLPATGTLNQCASRGGKLDFNLRGDVEGGGVVMRTGNCLRAIPDGKQAIFFSGGQLTADDTDAAGDIYLYDLEKDQLTRVSAPSTSGTVPYTCNKETSNNPTPTAFCNGDLGFSIEGFHTSVYGNPDTGRGWGGFRYTNIVRNEDGSISIFFESRSELAEEDNNGDKWDTYEWRDGELSLISRGLPGHHSYFSGNSEDGEDVFIWTTDRIDPRELDAGSYDIYDARVGGGFPYTPPPTPCDVLSLACESEATPSPVLGTPPTTGFSGQGNVQEKGTPRPRKCAKGKVRRKGKCVSKRSANRSAKRASRNARRAK